MKKFLNSVIIIGAITCTSCSDDLDIVPESSSSSNMVESPIVENSTVKLTRSSSFFDDLVFINGIGYFSKFRYIGSTPRTNGVNHGQPFKRTLSAKDAQKVGLAQGTYFLQSVWAEFSYTIPSGNYSVCPDNFSYNENNMGKDPNYLSNVGFTWERHPKEDRIIICKTALTLIVSDVPGRKINILYPVHQNDIRFYFTLKETKPVSNGYDGTVGIRNAPTTAKTQEDLNNKNAIDGRNRKPNKGPIESII